ncbi:MAG: HAMP domain-containing sensor histidine kinase, partial [Desulfobacula sp.]
TEHTIEIIGEDDIELNSFPGAFSQILNNLIMNSLIHGFQGMEKGVITVDISCEEKNIIFVYRDNGRGMNEEEKEKVFDPFFTTRRGKGGTGLGMSIVFNLVTQTLKGSIECESSPGNGVVFTMKFPGYRENN